MCLLENLTGVIFASTFQKVILASTFQKVIFA
jgi:hypothetical protein